MARNAAEARAMVDAAHARPHLVAQVVPSPFTLRVDNTIKRLLREGFLGDLLAIEVRAGGAFLNPDTPLSWRQDSELSGLNVMSLGIWYEALQRWAGDAARVMAMGKVFVTHRKDSAGQDQEVRIPEHLDVVGEMADGAQLHMQVSAVIGLAGPPEVFLFGSQGTLCFSETRLSGGWRGDRALVEIPIPPGDEGG